MSSLAQHAISLADRGFAVFPLTTGSKIPLAGSHGCREATTDSDVVRDQWAENPSANIGVATGVCSGRWVLDIDPRHGGDQSLNQLEDEHGPLPTTITVSTPSGGRHFHWRCEAGSPEIRNSASRVGPGIDVRGEGGYGGLVPSWRGLPNGRPRDD